MNTTTTTVTTNAYGTTTTQTTVKTTLPNIYNDKGCSGSGKCKGFSVYVPCIADLYGGLRYCQDMFILGKDGQPLDTSRLEYFTMTINNEYDCPVMVKSTDDGSITFEQKKYDGTLFKITPKNFRDYEDDDAFFEVYNTTIMDSSLEVCPDDYDAIIIGRDDTFCKQSGHILFNPFEYYADLAIKITPADDKTADCICELNGMPQSIIPGESTPLMNIMDSCKGAVLKIASMDSYYESTVAEIKEILITCTKGITDQGKIRVCYTGDELNKILPTALHAVFKLKFWETDAEEQGAEYAIPCTSIAVLH